MCKLCSVSLKCFVVFRNLQSEYLAECHRRLEYVSGFSGSAGTAVVTENEANMWTDGRYFIQAAKEMDSNWKLMKIGRSYIGCSTFKNAVYFYLDSICGGFCS